MKSGRKLKFIHSFLGVLLVLAPTLVQVTRCATFWGEPEVPESLRR